jgi:hypothetical protein
VKNKHLTTLLVSIIVVLIIVLVATTCTAAPTTTTPAATTTKPAATTPAATTQVVIKDKTYKAVNPEGIFVPVETKSLAPRLDTLDGKVIYVNQGEADPVIMPALWTRLQKDYPKVTWKLIASSSFGPNAPEAEVLAGAKAVIRGIGW